ncbi:MAG: fructose-1,6-bisphosphatase [Oscillospiraceae bacterium]|nr:fructose-1,6-bisphosphatase [Oscillospiraceae bacterium]
MAERSIVTTDDGLKYLKLLSRDWPNATRAANEIISLEAKLKLPKGTEMYMSDLHGEDQAFTHILNNASGVIREKIDVALADSTTPAQRAVYASLIYYPRQKLAEIKQEEKRMNQWYRLTIYRLIDVCRHVASKNTRADVRKAIPPQYAYVIDELLHAHFEDHNKEAYYNQFISAIIETNTADDFIEAISTVIKRLAVHKLHIVGDMFDRGSRPDIVMDLLMSHHAVDIQWGNHDALWMCGATGSPLGVASVIRICAAYNNLVALEEGYGINLRPLTIFAQKTYGDCSKFMPRNSGRYNDDDALAVAKIHKAISIIMYKLECQVIERNDYFEMDDRKMLEFIDYKKGTIMIGGEEYPLKDKEFPTVDPDNPAKLTREEIEVMAQLCAAFKNCEKLQRHMRFMYSHGTFYKVENGILMFHGVMPLNPDGSFREVNLGGKTFKGKPLFDYLDTVCRDAYYGEEGSLKKRIGEDILWYLWCGKNSPLFGRSKMVTFENIYLEDKKLKVEEKDPYYLHQEDKRMAERVLAEFGLSGDGCRIINGHTPVKAKDGEEPIKAEGKIIVIDGGFARAYHDRTGIAGYTMVFSSRGQSLRVHQPFTSFEDVIYNNSDIHSKVDVFSPHRRRVLVEDTDEGRRIKNEIRDLKALIRAYKDGTIKEIEG